MGPYWVDTQDRNKGTLVYGSKQPAVPCPHSQPNLNSLGIQMQYLTTGQGHYLPRAWELGVSGKEHHAQSPQRDQSSASEASDRAEATTKLPFLCWKKRTCHPPASTERHLSSLLFFLSFPPQTARKQQQPLPSPPLSPAAT